MGKLTYTEEQKKILYSVLEARTFDLTKYLQRPDANPRHVAKLTEDREYIYNLLQQLDGEENTHDE